MSRSMLAAGSVVSMYIDKFKKVVTIESDHPLAVAQIAKNAQKGHSARVAKVESPWTGGDEDSADEDDDVDEDDELTDDDDAEVETAAPARRPKKPKKRTSR